MPKLDIPSRQDVEFAIQAMEIEEQREKDAIRKFWERERESSYLHLSGKQIWTAFWRILFWVSLPICAVLAFARRMGWL